MSMYGRSVADVEFNPASAAKNKNDKLMSPNAKEDPETVSGTNPQKAFKGAKGTPQAPFGPRGRNF